MSSQLKRCRPNTPFSTQLLKIGDGLNASDNNEYIDSNAIGLSVNYALRFSPTSQLNLRKVIDFVRELFFNRQILQLT